MYHHILLPQTTPLASDSFGLPLSRRLLLLGLLAYVTLLFAHTSLAGFSDVTTTAGLNTTGYTFGDPIWGDFDGDGNLDLFVDNHYNRGSYLYHNLGQGRFTDILDTSGLIHA